MFFIKYECPFDSDEFKMFNYKVDLCPRNRSHDWTSCPYADKGKKAWGRDPVRYNYAPFPCPKGDNCEKGNACGLAHVRVRTLAPSPAHKQSEFRREAMYKWYWIYKP